MKPWTKLALVASLLAAPALALAAPHAQAPSPRVAQAFAELHKRYAAAEAVWQPGLAGPQMLVGLEARPDATTDRARAHAFLRTWEALMGVRARDLRFLAQERSKLRVTVRFAQTFDGLEVLDRYVAVVLDTTGTVLSVGSDAVTIAGFERGHLGRDAAVERALRHALKVPQDRPVPAARSQAREVVFAAPGLARHAWAVRVVRAQLREHLEVVVDATSGAILQVRNLVRHG